MVSLPNLASRSEVLSIYKCPTNISGVFPKKLGQNHQILNHFSATSALDTAYLWNETSHGQTKMLVSIYNVSPQAYLVAVTFDPETALRFLISTQHSAAITLQPSKLRHL